MKRHPVTYYHAPTATIAAKPSNLARLDNGAKVLMSADIDAETLAACGWFQIVDTARPDDTPTTTFDRSVELVAGVPTVVWTERPKTTAEMAAEADAADRQAKAANITPAMIATLRQWATDAKAIKAINTGNRDAVLLATVNRLGVFFDRFADLIEALRLEDQG